MERALSIENEARSTAKSLKWIKLIGIGNVGVGKTSIIKHFCEGKFSAAYQPTIGVDYGFKVQLIGDIEARVHLWDLSGHDDYLEVRNELYHNADGIFIVFDITNQASFERLGMWLDEATQYCDSKPAYVLVGTKSDLHPRRAVSTSDAVKWAQAHNMNYAEVSSANGSSIDEMFGELLFATMQRQSAKSLTAKDVRSLGQAATGTTGTPSQA